MLVVIYRFAGFVSATITADREFHPAPKVKYSVVEIVTIISADASTSTFTKQNDQAA